MKSLLSLFARLIARPLLREPIRSALTLLAVGLGVAVVIAIDLAGQAAAGSFQSSVESLTGKTDLTISATGGLDETTLGQLIRLPYDFHFKPRIEDFAFVNGKGEAIPFIGLDLIGEAGEIGAVGQDNSNVTAERLESGNPVWVGGRLGLHEGETVNLVINDASHQFTVAGIIAPSRNQMGEADVILADIGLAQKVTGKTGKLDRIDVRLPNGDSVEHWREILQRHLPPSLSIELRGAQTEGNQKMLSAFRWNLRVLSYIALVVGAFLIYNTISISVVRRRAEIGIIRAIGATRGLVGGGFVSEALLFGVAGSVIGVILGRVMAIGAVKLIGSTVESLYVSSHPAPAAFTAGSVGSGVAVGILISVLAAILPASEAASVAPVEAMARGREQYVANVRSRRTAIWAAFALLLAAALSQLPPIGRQPVFAYLSVLLLIIGTAVSVPNVVTFLSSGLSAVVLRLTGVEGGLAMRSLCASLGRTSVLTAALATAIAMTASVGIMVGSFRQTVSLWMNNELKADFYLRPAGSSAADRHPTLRPEIADRIEHLPEIDSVDRFRAYPITYQGMPATLAGGESSKVANAASTRFLPGEDRDRILATLPTGDYAVVSEPFANKHNVHVGSVLNIPLAGAVRHFEVVGIYYDYSTERGFIVLDRRTLLKYLPDPAASNLAVYLKPGANRDSARAGIDRIVSGKAILVISNSTLRRAAIDMFDRTFRITYALEAIAIFVAVIGIAGSLLAMVIDRRREFALLRIMGASQGQVRKIILCEAGLLALFSNAIGLVLGTLLSLILIFVINKQSFGWTIQFHWPVAVLLLALTGIYLATLAAGLYPARTAIRLIPVEVIHEE
ncbi:MAG: FtsX-like permease family protein [Acidobacteriaceae bacterium]|nr:FtsX-like permease family protein [Acidobacteriaceae bacterium]